MPERGVGNDRAKPETLADENFHAGGGAAGFLYETSCFGTKRSAAWLRLFSR
jgi:hypothetical protein